MDQVLGVDVLQISGSVDPQSDKNIRITHEFALSNLGQPIFVVFFCCVIVRMSCLDRQATTKKAWRGDSSLTQNVNNTC